MTTNPQSPTETKHGRVGGCFEMVSAAEAVLGEQSGWLRHHMSFVSAPPLYSPALVG